jgi:WS/DGAT/MGAT family acyltransferase
LAQYDYERLTAQDNSFLLFEEPGLYMHVSATQLFELGPLRTPAGGVDYERIREFIGAILHRIPRYRQKLAWVPIENHPVWVDDPDFDLSFHVRHTSLPQPGSDDQLKKLAARVMAQHLDRQRPLWEIWVVEGLADDRFALISKIHHCMIDGMSGVDISQILQSPDPSQTEIPDAPKFLPRPIPRGSDLFADALRHRLGAPFRALGSLRAFRAEAEDLGAELRIRARAVQGLLASQMTSASETPINSEIGPHRVFDWLSVPLDQVKALRKALGCTVNDVVLTIVTGAFRRYFTLRAIDLTELDFRVQAPVSVRSDDERGKLGNRISAWVIPLPLGEESPLRQLEAIHATTQELKESRQALGVEMMMGVMEGMPGSLLSLAARSASAGMSTIVTNVPGPQFPLYLLGARLLGMFPQVPLLRNVGLGIALISYDGIINWGFNADPKLVPDLPDFVDAVRDALQDVAQAAGVDLSPAAESSA